MEEVYPGWGCLCIHGLPYHSHEIPCDRPAYTHIDDSSDGENPGLYRRDLLAPPSVSVQEGPPSVVGDVVDNSDDVVDTLSRLS